MNFAELFTKLGKDMQDMWHYIILLFIIVSCLLFFYYVTLTRFQDKIWKLEMQVHQLTEAPGMERLQKI